MKFRKGLISAATAAAVLTSGVSVATAADKPTVPAENKAVATTEGSSIKDLSPKEIQDWIAVVTAVVSLIGSIYAFAQKYMKP